MAKIKLDPNSLNEWTLEININHELANMFDSPFGIFYPIRLRKIFDILPINISHNKGEKTKFYKLTPREEGAGGGWDAKFIIPKKYGRDRRAIFIQYKAGKHESGNSISGSLFNLTVHNPNPHVQFSFNDNDKPAKGKLATQHQDLKNIADLLQKQGLSAKSVMYAFPRITTIAQYENLKDPLILHTTFMPIQQMDAEAKKAGANLYDGLPHNFRTCYKDETRREIASEIFTIESPDISNDFLVEIMKIKLAYIWNDFYDDTSFKMLRDAMHVAVADYLQINPYNIVERPFNRDKGKSSEDRTLFDYFKRLEQDRIINETEFLGKDTVQLNNTRRRYIFRKLHDFFQKMNKKVNISEDIPSEYTFILSGETNIEFSDFGDVSASLVVL
jgi:hypothetical protein